MIAETTLTALVALIVALSALALVAASPRRFEASTRLEAAPVPLLREYDAIVQGRPLSLKAAGAPLERRDFSELGLAERSARARIGGNAAEAADISLRLYPDRREFDIVVRSREPDVSARLANAFADALIAHRERLVAQRTGELRAALDLSRRLVRRDRAARFDLPATSERLARTKLFLEMPGAGLSVARPARIPPDRVSLPFGAFLAAGILGILLACVPAVARTSWVRLTRRSFRLAQHLAAGFQRWRRIGPIRQIAAMHLQAALRWWAGRLSGIGPWPAAIAALGALAYFLTPHGGRFPAVLVTHFTFAMIVAFLPAARPVREPSLCPTNWATALFFLQLVVVPLLLCIYGPYQSTLPSLPSDGAINVALLISSVSFAAFGVGCQLSRMRSRLSSPIERPIAWRVSPRFVALFTVGGLIGIALAFGSFSNFVSYYARPMSGSSAVTAPQEGSLVSVASIFLMPFLGFACVLAWCLWLDISRRRNARMAILITVLAAAAVTASYSAFSYNRGAFAAPLVSLAAVYTSRVRQIRVRWLLVGGIVGLILLTGLRAYRNVNVAEDSVSGSGLGFRHIAEHVSLNKELQVYAGAPQFAAFLLEQSDYGSILHFGKTLVSSALYPVPVLGEPFRPSSGVELYNRLIYGGTDILDQVIPFQSELFINFSLLGIIIGYGLVGFAIAHLQERFRQAPTALQAFVYQYLAFWIAFLVVGGIAVLSQVLIYFFPPIYVVAAWTLLRRSRMRAAITKHSPRDGLLPG